MAEKTDFKKALKQLYNPSQRGFHLVEVPAMNFLMLDGKGDPNLSPVYPLVIEALYGMSYGLKFAMKSMGYDHIVPPIEGLWWMDDYSTLDLLNKDKFIWTMMIMQPEWMTIETVEDVRGETRKKKPNPLVDEIRFERYSEGLSVQTLYTGAYNDEAPTIAGMHSYILANGYVTNGKHHEIYLGDPRKTAPDKLKTILRQPVKPTSSQ